MTTFSDIFKPILDKMDELEESYKGALPVTDLPEPVTDIEKLQALAEQIYQIKPYDLESAKYGNVQIEVLEHLLEASRLIRASIRDSK